MGKCRKSSAQSGAFNLENIKVNAIQPFTTITNEFIRNSNLSLGAYKTFINLLSYSNNFEISTNNLSKLLKRNQRTIARDLKELQEKQYLNIVYDKESKTHIYNLNETPNKPKLKPTKKTKQESINLLKYALKKAKENTENQTDKQALSSIEKTIIDLINKEAE